jgi:hypothetical protein
VTILDRAVERAVLADHDGRSGAKLERAVLDDGSRLIVKTANPRNDITMAAGGNVERERVLFESGALDRLRGDVGHAIVEMWSEGDDTVTVMRDLGDAVQGWERIVPADEVDRIMRAISTLHRTFLDDVPECACPLETRLGLLGRVTMRSLLDSGHELPPIIVGGWDRFDEIVPADVRAAVDAVHADTAPLGKALRATGPMTLAHADLWLVNLAIETDTVVLLDWAIASEAPPVLDLSNFLTGTAAHMESSREDVIEMFRRHSPSCNDDAVALGLLAGICEMGWNKALDATSHEDPAMRARERADLEWWVARARETLDRGLL